MAWTAARDGGVRRIIMGHEASGVIAEVGAVVKGWWPGQRVTFDSTIYCGACEFCRRGHVNLCHHRRVLGVSCEDYSQNGAFAEFVAVPQRVLYRLPDALSFEHAAMVEPFAIALHAVRRAPVIPTDSAVVIGCGMIGLALIQALRAAGCGHIIALDVAPDKLALAKKLGAAHVIDSGGSAFTGDFIADATGAARTSPLKRWGSARRWIWPCVASRKGGCVALVGNVAPKVELPLQMAVTRELSVLGSCASAGEYPACLDMLARRTRLTPRPCSAPSLRSHEGASWFDRLYAQGTGPFKVVLTTMTNPD